MRIPRVCDGCGRREPLRRVVKHAHFAGVASLCEGCAPRGLRYRAVSRVGVEERASADEAIAAGKAWLTAGAAKVFSVEILAGMFGWWAVTRWTIDASGVCHEEAAYDEGEVAG